MKNLLTIQDKTDRLERFLYDLDRAIHANQTFSFSLKTQEHKTQWNVYAISIRTMLIEGDFIEPSKAGSKNTYSYTEKGASLAVPDIAMLLLEKIDKAKDSHFEAIEEDLPAEEAPEEEPIDFEDDEPAPINFDEIEWGIIKAGLQKIIHSDDEIYSQLAQRVYDKI